MSPLLIVFGLIHMGYYCTLALSLQSIDKASCKNPYHFGNALNEYLTLQMDRISLENMKPIKFRICKIERPSRPLELVTEPQRFQKVADRDLYVFSAYFDEREEAGGPAIRVIGGGLQERFHKVGLFFCQLWYPGRSYPIAVQGKYQYIYPSTAHAEEWTSHFILCPLAPVYDGILPTMVSVTASSCAKPNNVLRVVGYLWKPKRRLFAVCYPSLYNRYREWRILVEKFELHKLLGVDKITIYKFSSSQDTNEALQSYLQDTDKWVDVVNWPFPPVIANVFWQRGSINDCYYRNRMHFDYISVHDLDEVLVPRLHDTWEELFKVRSHPQYGSYLFQHAYHRRNHSLNEHPHLITQTSLYRTINVTPEGRIRSKALHHSDKVVCVDLHFACELVPGAKEYIVDPKEGLLHHYRAEPMENFRRYPEIYHYIEDTYMRKYKSALVEAFMDRIHSITKSSGKHRP